MHTNETNLWRRGWSMVQGDWALHFSSASTIGHHSRMTFKSESWSLIDVKRVTCSAFSYGTGH